MRLKVKLSHNTGPPASVGGDEPVVGIGFQGMVNYAGESAKKLEHTPALTLVAVRNRVTLRFDVSNRMPSLR